MHEFMNEVVKFHSERPLYLGGIKAFWQMIVSTEHIIIPIKGVKNDT